MKNLIVVLLLIVSTIFTSCQKENLDLIKESAGTDKIFVNKQNNMNDSENIASIGEDSAAVQNATDMEMESNETEPLFNAQGVVRERGGIFVIETSETIYAPTKLPEDYQKVGKTINFTAQKLPVPPYVRLIGYPIEIISIIQS